MKQWDAIAAQDMINLVLGSGWARLPTPYGSVVLCGIAALMRPVAIDEIDMFSGPHGLDGPCWPPFTYFTDEELDDIRTEFGDGEVAELLSEHEANRAELVAEMDRYAAYLGLPPVRMCRELVGFLVQAGALVQHDDGTLSPRYPMCRMIDVLPVPPEERAIHLQLYGDGNEV